MADQELGLKIKTDSDVPEAMGKAQKATSDFAKQAEALNKRFKDSIKDILLSVAGPMAAVSLISQKVSDYFEKIKQAQEDANKSAIDGIDERISKEDIYWARKTARENEDKKSKENAARQPQTTAYEFLLRDPRAKEVLGNRPFVTGNQRSGLGGQTDRELFADIYSKDPKIQEKIRQIISEDLAKSGMIAKPGEASKDFKVDGFSNVVGVGANPVLDAMSNALEVQKEMRDHLKALVDRNPFASTDFTKESK